MSMDTIETTEGQEQPQQYTASVAERAKRLLFGINDPEKAHAQALKVQDKRDQITSRMDVIQKENESLEKRITNTRDPYLAEVLTVDHIENNQQINELNRQRKKTT